MTFTTGKPFRIARVAFAAALLGAFGGARASDVTPHDRMPSSIAELRKMKPIDMMHRMDRDKDKFVTKKEFMEFYDALFEQLDRANTGRLGEPVFTDAG